MDTVNFYPKTFQEIPEQDNPAFDEHECLMIVAESNTNSGHAVVLHIKPGPVDSVNHIAKFWDYEKAEQYCDTFA